MTAWRRGQRGPPEPHSPRAAVWDGIQQRTERLFTQPVKSDQVSSSCLVSGDSGLLQMGIVLRSDPTVRTQRSGEEDPAGVQ